MDGATAAGLALAAAHVLQDRDHQIVLLFLIASYMIWGAGLRANLQANQALLESTGTSTNILSKAAYDLVSARTANPRARRLAAAVGYAGTELAKEAPYYGGAVGAALLSDAITAKDAMIFLGGANLGAAFYEYALAYLTRMLLRRKKPAMPVDPTCCT